MYTTRSAKAGFPSLADCQGCHRLIRGSTSERRTDINTLFASPVPASHQEWTRVNDLPDHVVFDHRFHVDPGFECEECHGDVKVSDAQAETGKVMEPTMGWCLECHKKKFNETQDGLVEWPTNTVKQEEISTGTVFQGSVDCYACHK